MAESEISSHLGRHILLVTLLLASLLDGCLASHFRGAHFWFYPTGEPNQISLAFRIAWRRAYSESTHCDLDTVGTETLMGPVDAGYIMCSTNCNFNVGNMDFFCTDYSVTDDWAAGSREHIVTFEEPGAYKLSWRGRSWLEEVIRGSIVDWEFLISVNTSMREDTGKMNSSPHSAATTILRLQQGCSHSVSIPVSDPDNDQVRCRWAADKECGGICEAPHNIQLHNLTCTLSLSDQLEEGLYALAIQIEDFIRSSDTESPPLSSVPLQFLLQVTSTPISQNQANEIQCNLGPKFIDPTPVDQQCIPLVSGVLKSLEIVVKTKDQFTGIKEINTASFLGTNKTAVDRYDSDPRNFHVTVTWFPEEQHQGDRIFCFVAVDTNGYSSEQRCIYLSVGLSSPTAQSVEYRPTEHEIIITFDQLIQMPRGQHELVIEDAGGSRVVVLDTSNSDMVSYTERSLIANLQRGVVLNGQYSIKLQSGAVRGVLRCGSDSLPVTDSQQLAFTAPQVTTEKLVTDNSAGVDQTQNSTVPTDAENNVSSSTRAPTNQTPVPGQNTDKDDKDYVWLIIVVVVVLFLLLLLIILAILCHRRINRHKYSRKHRQEEYLKSLPQTKVVGYDGPYAPNFHDIEVKFR